MDFKKETSRLSRNVVGFTLIELLTVLAVLSVLMALLLPALRQVRKAGRQIVCQNNLREITKAWQMYFDDHDGRFFRARDADFLYGGWKSLDYKVEERPLNAYVKLPKQPQTESEAEIFKCPSDRGDIGTDELLTYSSRGTSYGTNIMLVGQEQIGPLAAPEPVELRDLRREMNAKLPGLRRHDVDGESRLMLISDMPGAMEWLPDYPHPDQHDWHGRRARYNCAFIDGGVESLRIRKGSFMTSDYSVIPLKELYPLAKKAQELYQ